MRQKSVVEVEIRHLQRTYLVRGLFSPERVLAPDARAAVVQWKGWMTSLRATEVRVASTNELVPRELWE